MATATWPAQLPGPLLASIREFPPDTRVATETDSGIPMFRRSSGTGRWRAEVQFLIHQADFEAYFLPFYTSTLKNGVLRFNMSYWRTGATKEFQFGKPDPHWTDEYPYWRVSATLLREP